MPSASPSTASPWRRPSPRGAPRRPCRRAFDSCRTTPCAPTWPAPSPRPPRLWGWCGACCGRWRAGTGPRRQDGGHLKVGDLVVEYSSGGYAVRPISGLSLEVHPSQLVLLLGASGSGKTTLLSVLAGILTPSAGSVQLGETD